MQKYVHQMIQAYKKGGIPVMAKAFADKVKNNYISHEQAIISMDLAIQQLKKEGIYPKHENKNPDK